jgi:threonine dehydrogenase-like Zn-dependent dehydrogenase
MKTIFFDQTLKYLTDYPKPSPAAGEALIKISTAGICNTDIEITRGYKNFKGVLGHEFVGRVEEINGDNQSFLGKRVVGDINCGCQKNACDFCSRKLARHCPDRTTLGIYRRNGCLAEYITLPVENIFQVPTGVADHTAVFTEPLSAAFEILTQIDIKPGHKVLIVGDGKLGLLINHAVSTTGADITHVGKHSEKLKLIQSNKCETILAHQLPDQQFDIVIEATGSKSGFDFSVMHTKPRGILVLKSTLASQSAIDLNPIVVNEITIIGSRCGLFEPALGYMAKGVDFSPLISEVFPIEKGLAAFQSATRKGALKVLIDF